MTGTDVATYLRQMPGMSAFALEDGVVHHTYSAYARGLDGLWGMYRMARSRTLGSQRDGILVSPTRRVWRSLTGNLYVVKGASDFSGEPV